VNHERTTHPVLRRVLLSLLGCLILAAAVPALASASASTELKGVWSFNGGEIAIHSEGPEGGLIGTVIEPTTFAHCPHQAGEEIWSGITLQPDGSYWGLHQWFYENGSCTPNPELGLTAFRVLSRGSGQYLRVCFSEPGNGQQPTIAADGTAADASFGCVDSALVAALPTSAELKPENLIGLRSNTSCVAARRIRIRIHDPAGDTVLKSTVTVSGGARKQNVRVVRHGREEVAIVHPGQITGGRFTVTVTLRTALGHTIKTKRTYRTCGPAKPRRKPIHKHG
jgi:hypothetical protein